MTAATTTQARYDIAAVESMTPCEVDTLLAAIHGERGKAQERLNSLDQSIERYREEATRYTDSYNATVHLPRLEEQRPGLVEQLKALAAEAAPLNAEFVRRGGWPRFFLVVSSDGLIHSHMDCSTCNNGRQMTRFGWLPALSGKTEEEAVADQGAYLCTICFPTAPVAWTNGREAEAAAKKATQCPGSGTYDYPRETARMGYYSGNYGVCSHCGQSASLTKTNKMRAHKPAA